MARRAVHGEVDDILRRSKFGGGNGDGLPEFEVRISREETYYIRALSARRALEAALASGEPDNENMDIKVVEVESTEVEPGDGDEPKED